MQVIKVIEGWTIKKVNSNDYKAVCPNGVVHNFPSYAKAMDFVKMFVRNIKK